MAVKHSTNEAKVSKKEKKASAEDLTEEDIATNLVVEDKPKKAKSEKSDKKDKKSKSDDAAKPVKRKAGEESEEEPVETKKSSKSKVAFWSELPSCVAMHPYLPFAALPGIKARKDRRN
jgi:hypothetical protein